MSAPRLNPASRMTKEPSARARTRIKEGQAFGARVMDPVLEDCIEFMLIDRPMTVLPRMHDYLLSMKEGRPIEASPSSAKSLDEVLREIKPVVETLIARAVVDWDASSDKNKAEEAMLGFFCDHMKVLLDESVVRVET